ncbi:Oligosaccaryltransferase-domain-containing protein [Lasiosphaeria miniovina]|uniref:Dolichyl-diphosphooligosaccharide--protein glycosyltransferase subunit 4 n=1 Tax=Lasiosphaeria miniovina TaxID=1954250 RepID=A0AA39ZZB4_9PEZI|nr:Oligosaccaryltransferase-domain-containing protein [Lasiosphaeria miniovina]KAK0706438.1 Oligosaccaryltransferase-domain-containing protein [Lasiosphaeria miniovina]
MITDNELYRLAIFFGSAAMVLIVVYHFFEVNAKESEQEAVKDKAPIKAGASPAPASTKTR